MGGKPRRRTVPPAEILAGHSPRVVALANQLRGVILGMVDGVRECGVPGSRLVGFSRRGTFAFVAPMSDHVRVGFEHGHALPDFAGLLEGDGQVRFVTVRTAAQARARGLKLLLSAALFDDETHGFRNRAR